MSSAFSSGCRRNSVPAEKGARLEAGFLHESFPLGSVGSGLFTVQLVDGDVRELVAKGLLEDGTLVKEALSEANEPPRSG